MMLEKRYKSMREAMFYDAFIAFTDITKQMTVPEVQQRITEQLTRLGPAAGRFATGLQAELRMVLRFALEAGRLPPIPDELIEIQPDGSEGFNYEVVFTSPLMLAQKNSERQALQNALALTGEMAAFDPNVLMKIDAMRAVDSIWESTGADPSVKRDDAVVEKMLKAAAQAQAGQAQADNASQAAVTAKDATQAQKNAGQAQAATV
jgi:hypothetical protein